MSMVDGCVLVVCSGANGRFWPWADCTDRSAPLAGVPQLVTGGGMYVGSVGCCRRSDRVDDVGGQVRVAPLPRSESM